jgi:hypothetical protein
MATEDDNKNTTRNIWHYDSLANSHMTPDITLLNDAQPCYIEVITGKGATHATPTGTALINHHGRKI